MVSYRRQIGSAKLTIFLLVQTLLILFVFTRPNYEPHHEENDAVVAVKHEQNNHNNADVIVNNDSPPSTANAASTTTMPTTPPITVLESGAISDDLPLLQFEKDRKGYTIIYATEAQKAQAAKNKRRCNDVKNRLIFVNYASHGDHVPRQAVTCRTALENGADACVMFGPDFLDEEFKTRNHQLLNIARGAGLWLWKPYILFHTLMAMQPGDYMFYNDCDYVVVSSLNPYICFLHEHHFDIVPFYQPYSEYEHCKADAYFLMNMEHVPNVAETVQPKAGHSFIKRTPRSLRFVGEWLTYAQDARIMSDSKSFIKKERKEFYGHRHDQTIWSLLSKKWNLTVFPDPILPWQLDSIQYYTGPSKNVLIKTYNPVKLDLPNHPVEAILRYCPFCQ